MSLSSAKTLLKVLGILSIIGGIILFILAVLLIVGGGMVASNPELAAETEVSSEDSAKAIAFGIGLIVTAIVTLIEGIFSVNAAKDSSKYRGAWIFSLVALILNLLGSIMDIASGGELSTIVGQSGSTVVSLLTFLAADTIKKDAQNK